MEPDLKPCPFCGASDTSECFGNAAFIRCRQCGCEGPRRIAKHEAAAAWNRRVPPRAKPLAWAPLDHDGIVVALVPATKERVYAMDTQFLIGGLWSHADSLDAAKAACEAHHQAAAAKWCKEHLEGYDGT